MEQMMTSKCRCKSPDLGDDAAPKRGTSESCWQFNPPNYMYTYIYTLLIGISWDLNWINSWFISFDMKDTQAIIIKNSSNPLLNVIAKSPASRTTVAIGRNHGNGQVDYAECVEIDPELALMLAQVKICKGKRNIQKRNGDWVRSGNQLGNGKSTIYRCVSHSNLHLYDTFHCRSADLHVSLSE